MSLLNKVNTIKKNFSFRPSIRPSKTILWSYLTADLIVDKGKSIGLDAASGKFKNFPLFKTKQYYGIDISEKAIKRGLEMYPEAIGIIADISTLQLPECSVDVVVSTNTLHQLTGINRLKAVRNLIRLVKCDGRFIIQMSIDDYFEQILECLQKSFSIVNIWYYRNCISCVYENLLKTKNSFYAIAKSKPFLIISFLISRIELLTRHKRTWNKMVYICCLQKKPWKQENTFSIDNKYRIDKNLYLLLENNKVKIY